ncbi:hypothetical protein ACTA71_008140 [Dictyostelium dimigraforme]
MWKVKKDIEGVSASSILTLKSVVSNEEAQVKSQLEKGITHSKPIKSMRLLSDDGGGDGNDKSNRGVSQRNQKDVETFNKTDGDSVIENSYNNLLLKSKLYNKLINKDPLKFNNNSNNYQNDYENDKSSLVDFQQKYIDNNNNNNNNDDDNNFKFNNHGKIHSSRSIPGMGNNMMMIHPEIEREKKRKLWEQEIEDKLNNDDSDDDIEQLKKQQKIDDMKREEEQTKLNRAKVIIEKESQEKEKQIRLDQINKQKKLALLKQKLKEKQQKQQQEEK